jgi:predicted HNH restriction endonuclease
MPVIIVVNDESSFEDVPGVTYEYGKRHAVALLQSGTPVIFYTGGRRSGVRNPRVSPLSNYAHYFAFGIVGRVMVPQAAGELYNCDFSEYSPFARPVMLRDAAGEYLEPVAPLNNVRGYFQNGVREVSETVFASILHLAGTSFDPTLRDDEQSPNVQSGTEGGRYKVVISKLERDRALRDRAISIHGLNCKACGFNFGEYYGKFGEGYIHVHHLELLASFGDRRTVNPETDLTVLCANCHCIVHRRRRQLLSIDELRAMITKSRKCSG